MKCYIFLLYVKVIVESKIEDIAEMLEVFLSVFQTWHKLTVLSSLLLQRWAALTVYSSIQPVWWDTEHMQILSNSNMKYKTVSLLTVLHS